MCMRLHRPCTSNANLMAAMCRANGIPARILAGYRTWAGLAFVIAYPFFAPARPPKKSPLHEHALVR
jgi:hypothetical protein